MLTALSAHRFRNLEPLSWQPGPGCQLLLGDNGAGKTSLLEAVYLLATIRSLRTAQLADCCRHGEAGFHLAGEVEAEQRTRLEVSWSAGKLERRLNGRSTSLAEHLAVLPVVAWTSEDAQLLGGPPERRRRFLDRGVVSIRPAALATLARYRRALGQKRLLLQRQQRGLEPWNQLLAAAAAELSRLRRDYVERLARAVEEVLESCRLTLPRPRLDYRPSPARGSEEAERVWQQLQAVAAEEQRRGQALLGPHRDELAITWGQGRELKREASAGERKALGLVLMAAHGRVLAGCQRQAIFLLDDADAELSAATLRALWPAFSEAGQLFASSNRPEVWKGIDLAARWHLREGCLEPA